MCIYCLRGTCAVQLTDDQNNTEEEPIAHASKRLWNQLVVLAAAIAADHGGGGGKGAVNVCVSCAPHAPPACARALCTHSPTCREKNIAGCLSSIASFSPTLNVVVAFSVSGL